MAMDDNLAIVLQAFKTKKQAASACDVPTKQMKVKKSGKAAKTAASPVISTAKAAEQVKAPTNSAAKEVNDALRNLINKQPEVKAAAAMTAEPAVSSAVPAAGMGDIPVLGDLGGAVLGGLGKATKSVGLPGASAKLEEWAGSSTGRNIAGSGAAFLAAVLATLAATRGKGGPKVRLKPKSKPVAAAVPEAEPAIPEMSDEQLMALLGNR